MPIEKRPMYKKADLRNHRPGNYSNWNLSGLAVQFRWLYQQYWIAFGYLSYTLDALLTKFGVLPLPLPTRLGNFAFSIFSCYGNDLEYVQKL